MSVFRGVCTICGASCWGRPLTEEEEKESFVCSSCKAAEQEEDLKKTNSNRVLTLSRRVDELLSENQKLRTDNENLRAEVDSLRAHNTELVDHIARLERFIDDSIGDARRKVLEATDD